MSWPVFDLSSTLAQIPGPTIRMDACYTYQLTVTNTLEGPNPGGEWNTMKDPNTTNIHTHGLHISGESPADDVLYVEILPGESHACKHSTRTQKALNKYSTRGGGSGGSVLVATCDQ